MDHTTLQKLRELPIEGVAERLGLRVQRHKSLCPFHSDSHPSLSYKNNGYRCFVCGAHGDSISLAMHMLNQPFVEACHWIANQHNINQHEWQPAQKPKPVKQYPPDVRYLSSLVAHPVLNAEARQFLFDQRHYNPKVIEWLGISSISQPTPCWRYGKPFYDAPSLLFPYRDANGRVQNVQSRYLGPPSRGQEGVSRFKFPPNGSIHIFNLPILQYLKPSEPLYVSEGITDCIAHLSSGHKAIAIPSATLLKPDDLEPLRGRELHIYPDRDEAGERLYRQLASHTPTIDCLLVRHELPDGCKDYSDLYQAKFNQ